MKLKNKINYILNNENGSFALESIINIGVSLCIICGIYIFFKAIFAKIYELSYIVNFYKKE